MNYLTNEQRESRKFIIDCENKINELRKSYKELSDESKMLVEMEFRKNIPVFVLFQQFLNTFGIK